MSICDSCMYAKVLSVHLKVTECVCMHSDMDIVLSESDWGDRTFRRITTSLELVACNMMEPKVEGEQA